MDLPTLAENLAIPDGYRTEIIEGSLVVSPTPSYRHARIIRSVERILDQNGPEGLEALQWVTVEIPQDEDRFVPDLSVLPTAVVDGEGWDGPDWLRSTEDLELAVEVVSRSSVRYDWGPRQRGTLAQRSRITWSSIRSSARSLCSPTPGRVRPARWSGPCPAQRCVRGNRSGSRWRRPRS
ncbi:Uma2 family endonuclease [Nocardiopsis salina]|uniref:Uma2 family endonuclease n=1 Tax=Nocardiopsis salina TaxID=245836 RepID=UPI001EFA02BD|nr:Uma2 family endonuclease [Nocardiopsis salina]